MLKDNTNDFSEHDFDKFQLLRSKVDDDKQLFSSLGMTFRTEADFYFYDKGTGKTFEIESALYQILTLLFENNRFQLSEKLNIDPLEIKKAFEEIETAINDENILCAPKMIYEKLSINKDFEDIYSNNVNTILLEVTEKCNLRCKYCIYQNNYEGYRNFGYRDMKWETAKEAIDFMIAKSNKENKYHVGFYGGEPLLEFDLIKKCIEYINSNLNRENVHFSITTNATLLTKEISKYLVSQPNIYITISLDGPECIHDEYRVYPNQDGSFGDTMKGIKNIFESCEEMDKDPAKILTINTVIDFPDTEEKYNDIYNFFKNNQYLNKSIQKRYSYASHGLEKTKYIIPNSKEERDSMDSLYKDHSSVIDWTIKHLKENTENNHLKDSNVFSYSDLNEMLVIVHKRGISDKPFPMYHLNACCMPGSRRLYVEVNGDFKPCERISYAPVLGNAKEGFNIEVIKKKYFRDFSEEVVKYCGNCWAANICGNCYIDVFGEKGINFDFRHRHCESYRRNLKLTFEVYHELLKKNKTSLKYLNDVVFN